MVSENRQKPSVMSRNTALFISIALFYVGAILCAFQLWRKLAKGRKNVLGVFLASVLISSSFGVVIALKENAMHPLSAWQWTSRILISAALGAFCFLVLSANDRIRQYREIKRTQGKSTALADAATIGLGCIVVPIAMIVIIL